MIVCGETNFVLELALLRDEADEAEAILALAESNRIKLVVPAFSVTEPFEAMTRRGRERRRLLTEVGAEIAELSRSKPYQELENVSRGFTSLLGSSADDEWKRLTDAQVRLLRTATIVPLTSQVIERAIDAAPLLDLSPQDAIVFSSIESHLETTAGEQSLFVTKNRKDFLTGEIQERLERLNCRLFTGFGPAHSFMESALTPP
jgi:hypothetical protein